MTTGEKLALLRKKRNLTQEDLAEALNVSRQSVSRWEMDAAFPETDKLIRLSKLFECSIDYLLNDGSQESRKNRADLSVRDYYQFIRQCGYFFLATSVDNRPGLRPFGMIYCGRASDSDDEALYIATDKRKQVYGDLKKNPVFEIAGYYPQTHKWIRLGGRVEEENSARIKEEMMDLYPNLRQAYFERDEIYLAIYKLLIYENSMA